MCACDVVNLLNSNVFFLCFWLSCLLISQAIVLMKQIHLNCDILFFYL